MPERAGREAWELSKESMNGEKGDAPNGRGSMKGNAAKGSKRCKGRPRYLKVPAPHMKLASSAVPEGVGVQLPIEAGHDRVARGAVSVVKAVIGIQC